LLLHLARAFLLLLLLALLLLPLLLRTVRLRPVLPTRLGMWARARLRPPGLGESRPEQQYRCHAVRDFSPAQHAEIPGSLSLVRRS
jgi:hypothetical protein